QAQANPAQVFGAQVSSYLNSIGLNDVDPRQITYQVNSADKLQNIIIPLGNGRSQTVFFNGGFPVPAGTAPQVAFSNTTGARRFLDVAEGSPATQSRLQTFYADPANAARRTNFNTNLQNITTAFLNLRSSGNLSGEARAAVQDALNTRQVATNRLAQGGLPNVLGVYQRLGDNLDVITRNQSSLNSSQRSSLNTLNSSLLPVGVQNYYLVPVGLSNTSAS
ncbi:MAG: hypothetical protein JNN15_11295, partial [Blastocatellia bacterium]|nr:hypothetical protein [Blastocatellia bacterium]